MEQQSASPPLSEVCAQLRERVKEAAAAAAAPSDAAAIAQKLALCTDLWEMNHEFFAGVEKQRVATLGAKKDVDDVHLQLQNLIYERNHYLREIAQCESLVFDAAQVGLSESDFKAAAADGDGNGAAGASVSSKASDDVSMKSERDESVSTKEASGAAAAAAAAAAADDDDDDDDNDDNDDDGGVRRAHERTLRALRQELADRKALQAKVDQLERKRKALEDGLTKQYSDIEHIRAEVQKLARNAENVKGFISKRLRKSRAPCATLHAFYERNSDVASNTSGGEQQQQQQQQEQQQQEQQQQRNGGARSIAAHEAHLRVLPLPLYTLFIEFSGYIEAFFLHELWAVEISTDAHGGDNAGDAQEPTAIDFAQLEKACGVPRDAATADDDNDDDAMEMPAAKRVKTELTAAAVGGDSALDKGLLRRVRAQVFEELKAAHSHAVVLKHVPSKSDVIFEFLPRLGVVTVRTSGHSRISHATVLCDLLSDVAADGIAKDSGEHPPSASVAYVCERVLRARLVEAGAPLAAATAAARDSATSPRTALAFARRATADAGRAYRWAQWLAGLESAPRTAPVGSEAAAAAADATATAAAADNNDGGNNDVDGSVHTSKQSVTSSVVTSEERALHSRSPLFVIMPLLKRRITKATQR